MSTYLETPDDMAWLKSVHGIDAKAAMLYGNEDAPDRVEAYRVTSPSIYDEPDVFVRGADGFLTNGRSGL